MDVRLTSMDPLSTIHEHCHEESFPPCERVENSEALGLAMSRNGQIERSMFFYQAGPTEKSDPPRKVYRSFGKFSGSTEPINSDLDRKFENFGWMGHASSVIWVLTNDTWCVLLQSEKEFEFGSFKIKTSEIIWRCFDLSEIIFKSKKRNWILDIRSKITRENMKSDKNMKIRTKCYKR